MAAPQITALPTPPSRADAPDLFSTRANAFLGALPTFRSEANAQAEFTDLRATAADLDATQTAADRVQTGLDRTATAADRVQTGLDRVSATASASTATTQAGIATGAASSANTSREQAALSASSAATSLTATLAAANLSGARAFASYALALAATGLTTNQVVFVAVDETMGNQGAYYRFNGTTLVFLRLQEYYTSPSAAVASDSVQNVLTKLLVATGSIPAAAPSLAIE